MKIVRAGNAIVRRSRQGEQAGNNRYLDNQCSVLYSEVKPEAPAAGSNVGLVVSRQPGDKQRISAASSSTRLERNISAIRNNNSSSKMRHEKRASS